jgi:arsenate reductase
MEKVKVLFVCVHNSSRSQMAEAFLNQLAGDKFKAESAERCPLFPGVTKRLGWSFEDPASFSGTHEDKLLRTRIVRDKIKVTFENFINEYHLVTF